MKRLNSVFCKNLLVIFDVKLSLQILETLSAFAMILKLIEFLKKVKGECVSDKAEIKKFSEKMQTFRQQISQIS